MSVNLLSFHFQKNSLILRRMRLWSVIWIGGLAAVLLWLMEPSFSLWRQRDELLQLQQEVQPILQTQAQNHALEHSIQRIRSEERRVRRLQPPERSLAILGILSTAVRQAGKLQIQRATMSLAPESGAAVPNSTAQGKAASVEQGLHLRASRQTLQLQGIAEDDSTVMKFVTQLQQATVLENVELKSTAEFALPRAGGRQFQIECRFGGAR